MLIIGFIAWESSLITNFHQQPSRNVAKLRFNIWVKFVENLLYPKVRSTAFLFMFLATWWWKTLWEKLLTLIFFSSPLPVKLYIPVHASQAERIYMLSTRIFPQTIHHGTVLLTGTQFICMVYGLHMTWACCMVTNRESYMAERKLLCFLTYGTNMEVQALTVLEI